MSDNKKYYWLKMQYDFFTTKEIKKLRKIAGGDTYTIIYLKMQLKSLKNDCKLYFEGVEDDFPEELALDIDEDVDNVRVTLSFLENRGLIELHNQNGMDEYHFIEAKENTGSETKAAIRVRKHRANKKALPSNNDVTKCNTELEKEKELEKDKKNTSSPKKVNAKELQATADSRELIKVFCELHSSESGGKKATITGAIVNNMKRLIKLHGLEEVAGNLKKYYEYDFWFTKNGGRTFMSFSRLYDEIITSKGTKRQNKASPPGTFEDKYKKFMEGGK